MKTRRHGILRVCPENSCSVSLQQGAYTEKSGGEDREGRLDHRLREHGLCAGSHGSRGGSLKKGMTGSGLHSGKINRQWPAGQSEGLTQQVGYLEISLQWSRCAVMRAGKTEGPGNM